MNLGTNLPNRVRNVTMAPSNALMPLFEAVTNSIHAIEEAELDPVDGRIRIEIHRQPPPPLLRDQVKSLPDIVGFSITDNGIGFNDVNFESFRTLDTEHKIKRGGKGHRPLVVAEGLRAC